MLKFILVFSLTAILIGCGQKGGLYVPKEPEAAEPTKEPQTSEPKASEATA